MGSKVTAMVGRGLPRDFIDVAAALEHYDREQLMSLAFARDPGLRVVDFVHSAVALDRIPAEAFTPYGLNEQDVDRLRARFADWPRHLANDTGGEGTYPTAPTSSYRPSVTPTSGTSSANREPPRT